MGFATIRLRARLGFMSHWTPPPGSPRTFRNLGDLHDAFCGPRNGLTRLPQGVRQHSFSSRRMGSSLGFRNEVSSRHRSTLRGRRPGAQVDGGATPRHLRSKSIPALSACAYASTPRLAELAPLVAPEAVREAARAVRVESLEPYFYYMARKWGVKAYGIEFRETLRRDPESAVPSPALHGPTAEEDAAAALLTEGALLKGVGVYAAQDIDTTQGSKVGAGDSSPLLLLLLLVAGDALGLTCHSSHSFLDLTLTVLRANALCVCVCTCERVCTSVCGRACMCLCVGVSQIVLEVPLPLMVTLSRDPPWMFFPNIVPLGHPIFDVIEATHPEVCLYPNPCTTISACYASLGFASGFPKSLCQPRSAIAQISVFQAKTWGL